MTGPRTVDEYAEWNAAHLARTPVTRRSVLQAAGVVAAQFALAGCVFSSGGGKPGTRGLVVAGRHLAFLDDDHHRPETAMALTAQLVSRTGTLPAGLRAYVDLGDEPGRYGTRVDAEITHLLGHYAIPHGPVGSQFYVKARLVGLRPGTVHHYRIRLSDGTTTGDAFFTTAPVRDLRVPAPFTFTAFADVGTDRPPTDPAYARSGDPDHVLAKGGTWPRKTFANTYDGDDPVAGKHGTDAHPASTQTSLMGTQRPAFTLLAGDICYADTGGNGLPADDHDHPPSGTEHFNPYVWDVFLDQIEDQAAYTPWMFATGNHDMEALYGQHGYGGHRHRLDLPGNGPSSCPSVYRFVYANVGVISVDANELSAEIQTNTGYSGGTQLAWLEATLKQWRTDPAVSPGIDFVVAFFHHCAYATTDGHGSDDGVRTALDPLFSKYRVDLAVQGHNHVLERTDPIRYGRPTRQAPDGSVVHPAVDGVTYVCAGSGGRARAQLRSKPDAGHVAAGVTPSGTLALPEGPRYRGYRPRSGENAGEAIVNAVLWTPEVNRSVKGHRAGTSTVEAIEWSQVRYDGYAFLAVDVVPAARGRATTMTVRTLADALPGTRARYTEIDRVVLHRTAGAGAIRTSD